MKNLNLTTRKALRLAASASLALVAMVSSAHAQSVTFSKTVTLRSGNDAAGQPLLAAGAYDANVTHTTTSDSLDAINGSPARVIDAHSGWTQSISDPNALWIHSKHDSTGTDGTGTQEEDVLYAHRFELPLNMPADATVDVQMDYAVDDRLQSVGMGDSNGVLASLPGFTAGSYDIEYSRSISGLAGNLGLSAGENFLFIQQDDTGGQYSGIIYSVTITVEYCVIEAEFRSGMRYHPTNGWLPFAVGSTVPTVRAVTLPEVFTGADLNNAFAILGSSTNAGDSAVVVNPNTAWGTLSQPTQWINSSMPAVGGDHDRSVLYALHFLLPTTLPQNLVATLDLEWEADDRLANVFMNGKSGLLGLVNSSSMIGPNSYDLPTTSTTTRSVGDLFLNPGLNTLYLLQEDVDDQVSGINYNIMLRITVPCENTPYEPFCDCIGALAPCGNQGLTYEEGCANSTGQGASLTSSGQALMGGSSSLSLHADNLPSGSIGLFFQGDSVIGPAPFGDGLRCVGGNIIRLGIGFEDGTGRADLGVIGAPASSGVKFYQLWYRDTPNASSPCHTGFNLSNGLALGWH